MKKIIITKSCRENMKKVEKNFLCNWEELIKLANRDGCFEELNEISEMIDICFSPFNIGYKTYAKTNKNDDVFYAKKEGEDIYSRFVRNKDKDLTSWVTIFLTRHKINKNKFYLHIIIPRIGAQIEPDDERVQSKEELRLSLEYWKNHAIVFEDELIDEHSITKECPYKYLYEEEKTDSYILESYAYNKIY